jgi:uncharacterized membrane protein
MRSVAILLVLVLCGLCVVHAQDFDEDSVPIITVASNTSTNATGCAARTSCGPCTDEWECVWCDSDHTCQSGNFWGPDDHIITGCDDWRWRQCGVNGKIVFWVAVAVAAAVVVLGLLICIICCLCCRRRRRSSYYELGRDYEHEELATREKRAEERKSRFEAKKAEYRNKYGAQDTGRVVYEPSPPVPSARKSLFA